MIFIAKDADFSENNLGQVSVKTIDDVSQNTYDVIAAYGNKQLTEDQIIALDDFLIALENHSAYDKMSYFVLPILAPETEPGTGDVLFIDTNPCYDIINKQRLTPGGYSGYITKHGLKVWNDASLAASINGNAITTTPRICTVGSCLNAPNLRYGYIFGIGTNICTFGAATKETSIQFSTFQGDTDLQPLVTTISRDLNGAYGCRNGEHPSSVSFNAESYAADGTSLSKYVSEYYSTDSSEYKEYVSAFMFFCNNYCMTQEELDSINKICYDLMVALW